MTGEVKPGPRPGTARNFVAPNAGAQGGRPTVQPSLTASPMETLPASLPSFMAPEVQQAQAPAPAPAAPASGAPPPVSGAESQTRTEAPQQTPAPQPVQQTQAPTPTSTPAQSLAPPTPTTVMMPKAPTNIVPAPDGSKVSTPLGTTEIVGGIPGNYDLTPQGRQAYARAKMVRVQKFGRHPWSGDPKAPQPPVEPSGLAFNPFTGAWLED